MNKRSLPPPPPSQLRFAGLVEPMADCHHPKPLTHTLPRRHRRPSMYLAGQTGMGWTLPAHSVHPAVKKHTNGGQVGRADDIGLVTLHFRHVWTYSNEKDLQRCDWPCS